MSKVPHFSSNPLALFYATDGDWRRFARGFWPSADMSFAEASNAIQRYLLVTAGGLTLAMRSHWKLVLAGLLAMTVSNILGYMFLKRYEDKGVAQKLDQAEIMRAVAEELKRDRGSRRVAGYGTKPPSSHREEVEAPDQLTPRVAPEPAVDRATAAYYRSKMAPPPRVRGLNQP